MANQTDNKSTAALAYLGDCVVELKVRTFLVNKGISSPGELNRQALDFVRATAQSSAAKKILPLLSEEETGAFRRGKNADHHTMPKSASPLEYRTATGFETLFGYLYLNGRQDRIDELFGIAYSELLEE